MQVEFWLNYWWILLLAILVLPVILIAGFALWMRSRPQVDLEAGSKSWDVFIKLISALTAIAAGALLVGKYMDQREISESRDARLQEAKFLQSKLSFDISRHEERERLFKEAARLAARLATIQEPAQPDITRFDELYFADLIGLEGDEVTSAMICFRDKFRGLRRRPTCDDVSAEQLALRLATAVKSELRDSEQQIILQQKNILETLRYR